MTGQSLQTGDLTIAVVLGLLGLGCGLALPSTIAASVISVPHAEGGMASASVNMFRQIGSALGASITGTIITTGIASRLPGELAQRGVPATARGPITHAVVAGRSPAAAPAGLRAAIESAAGSAFADALHVAVLSVGVSAVVMTAASDALMAPGARSPGRGGAQPAPRNGGRLGHRVPRRGSDCLSR
jgi:DHA2 family multidrug resistance protein-like MFS transporter